MNKKEAKDLLESYVSFLKKNIPGYSQQLDKKLNEKWESYSFGASTDKYNIRLCIEKKGDKDE